MPALFPAAAMSAGAALRRACPVVIVARRAVNTGS